MAVMQLPYRIVTLDVCGMLVRAKHYPGSGGHLYISPTGSDPYGVFSYFVIGKDAAAKLTKTLFASRPPRPGYVVTLCDGWRLTNRGGKFELQRRR